MQLQLLTPLKRLENETTGGTSRIIWLFKCECGDFKKGRMDKFKSGGLKSCGCISTKRPKKPPVVKKIKKKKIVKKRKCLLVLNHHADKKTGEGEFDCLCGNKVIAQIKDVLSGKIVSCGHKVSKDELYTTWSGMKHRCHNEKSTAYKYYGAKGVIVCEEWRNDFYAFKKYMGERPKGYSIDRIDPFGNYEKGNCRWADKDTQNENMRSNYLWSREHPSKGKA